MTLNLEGSLWIVCPQKSRVLESHSRSRPSVPHGTNFWHNCYWESRQSMGTLFSHLT